jgi:predicted secreted protein
MSALRFYVLFGAAALAGCQAIDIHKPKTVVAPEGGGELTVKHGQRLRIPLPAEAQGDGYSWRQRAPLVMAVIIESPPEANVWSFTPVRSGKETLRLELARPGEADVKRTISYEVEVP